MDKGLTFRQDNHMGLLFWHRLWLCTLGLILLMYAGSVVWMRPQASSGVDTVTQEESILMATELPDRPPLYPLSPEKLRERVSRYALAGTFQVYPTQASMALVDDMKQSQQLMVWPGEHLGPFIVEAVTEDSMRLRDERGEVWTLTLSGQIVTPVAAVQMQEEAGDPAPARFEDLPALETTPFGKRVGENQWVVSREKVKAYATEVMSSPLRIADMYRSFAQVQEEDANGEPGFRVGMKGEKDFFGAMGLSDGDVIRRVNSMQMKNTGRAEYFLREFMQDRMSELVVLDIERNGQPEKLIFILSE
jgi:hypothetical protein